MFTRFFRMVLLFSCTYIFFGCDSTPRSKYAVAIDPLWYPLNFSNKENNITGFSTELLTYIAQEENLSLSILHSNWDTLLQGLRLGTYNAVLSSLYPYNFHTNQYDFSMVYLQTGPVLILPIDSKTKSLKDLHGKEVGLVSGSPAALIIETYPDILIRSFESPSAVINALLSGNIDGALLPILIAESFIGGPFKEKLKISSPPLNEEGLRLITLKGQAKKLLERFNKGLKKMQKNSAYEKMLDKWDLDAGNAAP